MTFKNGDKELLIRLDEKLRVLRKAFETENAAIERELNSMNNTIFQLQQRVSKIEDDINNRVVNRMTLFVITTSSAVIGTLIGIIIGMLVGR